MTTVTERTETNLDPALSEEFLSKMAAWHRFEQSPVGSGEDIIDLQTVPLDESDEFQDRQQVQEWLSDHISRTPIDVEIGRQHALRCDGLLAYTDALQGVRLSLPQYISRTLGMILHPYSEGVIMEVSREFAKKFADEGFSFNEAGWRRFREAEPLTVREIKRVVRETKRVLAPIILGVIERENLRLDFRTGHTVVERPWISRIIGGPDKFLQEVNLHPINEPRYYKGVTEHVRVHELFHLIQALCFRDNVYSGRLDRSWGITTIPGIEQGPMEGMAQDIPLYIPEVMSTLTPFGKLALEYSYLYDLVYSHAVLIMANDGISSDQDIMDFVKEYLPGETPTRIISLARFRSDNPRYRSYAHSYYVSHYLREKAEELDEQQKLAVVKFVCNNPVTFDELDNYIEQLKAI